MSTLIRLPVAIAIFAYHTGSAAEVWTYQSLMGDSIEFRQVEDEWSVRSRDVTQTGVGCADDAMPLCLISDRIDISIPRNPPSIGVTWTVQGTQFKALQRVASLTLVGTRHDDVYVFEALKSREYYYGLEGNKRFLYFYSYQTGLIAFSNYPESSLSVFVYTDSPLR